MRAPRGGRIAAPPCEGPGVSAHHDPALDTLLLPFADGMLRWPADGRALFLHARDGWALRRFPLAGLVCEQGFKPFADVLAHAGLAVVARAEGRFPLVLALPPRQRDEARALLARALDHLEPGGVLVACQSNLEGARSGEDDLARLAGLAGNFSKHKCRVYWTRGDAVDAALHAQWRVLDAPRPILDGRFLSRPGLFAWDRVDAASALLAARLPDDLAGHGADLGAGWGWLAAEVLARCPQVTAIDLYEAQACALALARHNLAGARVPVGFHWHDVRAGLSARYDFIVTNPPFHQGRADEPRIGQDFIRAAAAALRPGGRLWLVANRHLPYESALREGFASARVVAEHDGFKVIEAVRA